MTLREAVTAVVVTYRAPEAVRACLAALREQTAALDTIIVVDNDGGSGIPEQHVEPIGGTQVRIVAAPRNLGPAGGYQMGIRSALATSPEFVWVLDDDVAPDQDCLARLLTEARGLGSPAVLFPRQWDTIAADEAQHWGWHGALIPTAAVAAAGFPRADFFWGFEDTEYFRDRLHLAGFPSARASSAWVKIPFRADDARRPAWKYYYETRNRVFAYLYLRTHIPRMTRLKSLVRLLLDETWRVWDLENERPQKFGAMALGMKDGVLRRLGIRRTPDSDDRPWQA